MDKLMQYLATALVATSLWSACGFSAHGDEGKQRVEPKPPVLKPVRWQKLDRYYRDVFVDGSGRSLLARTVAGLVSAASRRVDQRGVSSPLRTEVALVGRSASRLDQPQGGEPCGLPPDVPRGTEKPIEIQIDGQAGQWEACRGRPVAWWQSS